MANDNTNGHKGLQGILDELDAATADAIVTSCFRHPFGPTRVPATATPVRPVPDTPRRTVAPAIAPTLLAAAETASAAEPAPDPESGSSAS